MPLLTLQQLAARERTRQRNRQLGALLAFMAGQAGRAGIIYAPTRAATDCEPK